MKNVLSLGTILILLTGCYSSHTGHQSKQVDTKGQKSTDASTLSILNGTNCVFRGVSESKDVFLAFTGVQEQKKIVVSFYEKNSDKLSEGPLRIDEFVVYPFLFETQNAFLKSGKGPVSVAGDKKANLGRLEFDENLRGKFSFQNSNKEWEEIGEFDCEQKI